MERKILYLVNPVSGTRDKERLKQLIKKHTSDQGIAFRIDSTDRKGTYVNLPHVIANEGITDIVVCGGDGTVSQVAAATLEMDINIGIIPMGSGNGLALSAGISRNPVKALEIIFARHSDYIDSFYFNDHFSCMLCGIGFDAQVAHDFAKQPVRGLVTYIRETVRNFFKATTFPFIVTIDNTRIETEAFFISIANSNQFGNNVTIAPGASLSDGLLDVVVVKKMNKFKMIYILLKQLRHGRVSKVKEHSGSIYYFQAKKLRVENPGGAPVHIDGEPGAAAPIINITLREKAFKLLQPIAIT